MMVLLQEMDLLGMDQIPTENIISPSTYDRTNGTAYSVLNSGYVTMYNGIDDGYSEIEFSYGMTSV